MFDTTETRLNKVIENDSKKSSPIKQTIDSSTGILVFEEEAEDFVINKSVNEIRTNVIAEILNNGIVRERNVKNGDTKNIRLLNDEEIEDYRRWRYHTDEMELQILREIESSQQRIDAGRARK